MFFFSISHFKGRALFCDEPAPGSSLTKGLHFSSEGVRTSLETLRLRLYDNRNAGIVPSSVINAHRKNCLKNIILAIFEAIFYWWGHQAIFCFFWAKFGCDFCKIWMLFEISMSENPQALIFVISKPLSTKRREAVDETGKRKCAVTVIPHTNWYFTVSTIRFSRRWNGNRHFFAEGVKERGWRGSGAFYNLLRDFKAFNQQKIRF